MKRDENIENMTPEELWAYADELLSECKRITEKAKICSAKEPFVKVSRGTKFESGLMEEGFAKRVSDTEKFNSYVNKDGHTFSELSEKVLSEYTQKLPEEGIYEVSLDDYCFEYDFGTKVGILANTCSGYREIVRLYFGNIFGFDPRNHELWIRDICSAYIREDCPKVRSITPRELIIRKALFQEEV